jgi:hypothetical protein
MRLPQYPGFRDDRERFALRFTCEDCALFDPEQESCAHGFPTAEHRRSYYESADAYLVFCKDFELK